MVSDSPWRDEELIGNPVKVRNYPRSCKLQLHIGAALQHSLATGSFKNREGVAVEASQKTCHCS